MVCIFVINEIQYFEIPVLLRIPMYMLMTVVKQTSLNPLIIE